MKTCMKVKLEAWHWKLPPEALSKGSGYHGTPGAYRAVPDAFPGREYKLRVRAGLCFRVKLSPSPSPVSCRGKDRFS